MYMDQLFGELKCRGSSVSLSDMDQQTCSRFSYLLEPIRDLTKNWEVDVAGQLDDYLSEVSSSTPAQWFINNINVYTCIYGIIEFGELRAGSVYYMYS